MWNENINDATIVLLEVYCCFDTQVRVDCVPLSVENVKRRTLARNKSEIVQMYGLFLWSMQATKVERQGPIDEHPDVIIPTESKILSTSVFEGVVHFQCEPIVVAKSFLFEASSVYWEKIGRVHHQGA